MINETPLKKGFSLIEIIVVIALAGIIAVGVYVLYFSNRNIGDITPTPSPADSILPTLTLSPSTIETTFRTYRNELVPNLIINYDTSWELKEERIIQQTIEEPVLKLSLSKENVVIQWTFTPYDTAGFLPFCYIELEYVSLDNYWARIKKSPNNYEYTNYLITRNNNYQSFIESLRYAANGEDSVDDYVACGADGWSVPFSSGYSNIKGAFVSLTVTTMDEITNSMLSEIDTIVVGSLADR